jgi:nucleoside-diphosphate-sugar epimerase
LIKNIPYVQFAEWIRRYQSPLTATLVETTRRFPGIKPVLPDPGVPFQLVHHDDVASAFRAAAIGKGAPGPYNLASAGELTMSRLADALGWYSFPVPESALDGAAELIARLPLVPAQAQWIESIRQPVLMDTSKARRELGWEPRYNAQETLEGMVSAAREQGLLELG